MEEVEEVGHRVGERVGDLETEGLLLKVGDAVKEFVKEGETLAEEDGDDLKLVLGEKEGERDKVGELDKLGEVEGVEDALDVGQGDNERVGERDWEGLRVIDGEAE